MKIALYDFESMGKEYSNEFPNVALMKISAYHKAKGDDVELFKPLKKMFYDKIYASKVFTWTKMNKFLPEKTTEYGGTGIKIEATLPDEIEHLCPDYFIYGKNYSMGFLTRGCIRKCPWCFVPAKEGMIRANADVEEFLKHRDVVFLDNNVLAHDHGIKQIEKMGKMDVRVDFNQGLDARLIDDRIARRLAKLKWMVPLKLACDQASQIENVRKAIELLRWHNCVPRRYTCLVLVQEVDDALERIKFLKGMDIDPYCQPIRDKINTPPTKEQIRFSRWVNDKGIYKTTTWKQYQRKHPIQEE